MIRGGRPDRSANIGLISVVADAGLEELPAEQRVGLAFGIHGRPGQGEIGVGRHGEGRGWQGQTVISGVDQGGDGKPAASGFPREGDVRRGGPVLQQSFVGRKGVVDSRRIRMFWGEPVVDGDDLGAGPPADLRAEVSNTEGVTQYIDAAMEVKNNIARFDSVDSDLGGWDATQCACGHGHTGGQRLRRCELVCPPPLLADVAVCREGPLPQDCLEVLSLLGAHGRSPFGMRQASHRLAASEVRAPHRISVIRATFASRRD
jgi:hypothetical protein